MRFVGACLAALCAVVGCAEDNIDPVLSRQQYCEELGRLDCHVFYDCYDEAMRQEIAQTEDIGTSKADCLMRRRAPCAATPFACPEDKVFQEMKAGGCIRAKDGLTCDDWLATTPPVPPACMVICADRVF